LQVLLGKHWHHLPEGEVIQLLETDADVGLDLFDIRRRQERFGPNRLTPRARKSAFIRFLSQFNNPLIYILLAATVITAVVKDLVDAFIILGVVLVNAIIGYIQESKAEAAIESLARTMKTEATVLRAGETIRLDAAELVPGDIVSIQAGDKVPADLRILRSRDLQIAEASLTGESLSVQKTSEITLEPDMPLAERSNMAYASTLVTYGFGKGVVTATGDDTEIGQISSLISSAQELATPLTRKIEQFSRLILYAILILAAVTFGVGVYRGQPVIESLTATIALAVGMIPEGLPAALTVTLAIGVSRMARRQAIIRKLPAVETLGSVTTICSDKTGTLTQNQMTVRIIAAAGVNYHVEGAGYEPAGEIIQLDEEGEQLSPVAVPSGALVECLKAGLLCNDSFLVKEGNIWEAQGDPTEVALIVAARKAGLDAEDLNMPRLDTIPFESEHQYMATLHRMNSESSGIIYLKGAVEVVLRRCDTSLGLRGQAIPLRADTILEEAEVMAAQGLRVLAFACDSVPAEKETLDHDDVAKNLTFLGLQAMIDPPRPEAIDAVQTCLDAGIQVKMITGDHALTAKAIAGQLGLIDLAGSENGDQVITGYELGECCDEDMIDLVENTTVFARVSPEQKLRLVEALQANDRVVSMTGDGVNDAPALKQADVGVAMGITGTDVAKESADMVLTDDNFASIEAAVEEGRGVFDNLTKIITWTLPTNLGEGLIILLAVFLGIALPILPVHILWINMTTVGVLGIVLALEPKEPGIMKRPPRDPQTPILTRELIIRILLVGMIILIGAFGLFEWDLLQGGSVAQARTIAVNVVVVVEIFYLFNCRSLKYSPFGIGLFSNIWIIIGVVVMIFLQLLFTYAPFMNRIFISEPIGIETWARIILVGFIGYLVVELEKWINRRRDLN
jgi:cation-transporting ATPase F